MSEGNKEGGAAGPVGQAPKEGGVARKQNEQHPSSPAEVPGPKDEPRVEPGKHHPAESQKKPPGEASEAGAASDEDHQKGELNIGEIKGAVGIAETGTGDITINQGEIKNFILQNEGSNIPRFSENHSKEISSQELEDIDG